MKIVDRIYGESDAREEVINDLINSKTLQRLKGISQFGMPDEFYHKKGFSRYEHCVGVMLLLNKLGAGLEERIAGLLHDASHTAFSHVIDWVIGDPSKEDYQDGIFIKFIEKSDVPEILDRYKLDYKKICDLEKFSLLENEAPDICADRVDYALREIVGFESPENFKLILNSLINYRRNMVFSLQSAAETFSNGYSRCQREHWAGEQAKARYHVLAGILKKGLELKIISLEDFWKTDYEIINILRDKGDKKIIDGLELLRKGFEVKESNGKNSFALKKKFRYVDPFVLSGDLLARLSDLSEDYKKSLENQKSQGNSIKYFEIIL